MTRRRASSTSTPSRTPSARLRHDPGRLRGRLLAARRRARAGRRCWSTRPTAAAAISDHGLVDLTLVAHEFGRRAAPGPLAPTNVVAAALSDVRRRGPAACWPGCWPATSIATWCCGEPPPHRAPRRRRPRDLGRRRRAGARRREAPGRVGRPRRPPARDRSHRRRGSPRCWSRPTRRVSRSTPLHTVDLTRRFSTVTFDGVRVPADRRRRRGRRGRRAGRAPAAARDRDRQRRVGRRHAGRRST